MSNWLRLTNRDFKKWFHGEKGHLFILTLLMLITRLPLVCKFLYEWDAVQYALSFKKFDLLRHHPHPPGYILFVALGKLSGLFIKDPNTNFMFWVLCFGLLTIYLTYFLGKEAFDTKTGLVSALLLMFNPIFWFYTETSTIYITEAFFCTLVAFLSYSLIYKSENKDTFLYLSSIALGIAGGIRQNIILFMLPLWLWAIFNYFIYTRSVKKILLAIILLIIAVLGWFLPLIYLAGGYKSYREVSQGLFISLLKYQSLFFGGDLFQFIRMLKNMLIWSLLDLSSLLVIIPLYVVFRKKGDKSLSFILKKPKVIFWRLWILPSFVFYTLIFISKAGYTLTYLPAIHIVFACLLIHLSFVLGKRYWLIALTSILIGLNIAFFLGSSYLEAGISRNLKVNMTESGHTLKEKIFFQMGLFFRFSNGAIRATDQITRDFIIAIRSLPYSPQNLSIIFFFSPHQWDWRKAMFYLPEYPIYLAFHWDWDAKDTACVLLARDQVFSALNQVNDVVNVPLGKEITHILWMITPGTDYSAEIFRQVSLEKKEHGLSSFYLSNLDQKPFSVSIKRLKLYSDGH